jgi:mono/diheme cytochrome c family protein
MSDHAKPKKTAKPPQAFGWIAEYADDNQLLDAARKVRDSGYTRTDAFTPFPVHGIDEALGIKATVLPWFTLCAGFAGITVALTMEYWMNAVDYPYIISGKPFASWPAFIPVAFELTVLFSAFTTVFAMLGLNGLPRFSHPVFSNPKFDRTTDDRFFLWIDSRDKYFNSEKVQSLLSSTGALSVEEVREDHTPSDIPKPIIFAIIALILVTLIPGALILNMRNAKSGQPRFHVFFDMDFQPSKHTQTRTTIFDDGRVQRPPVAGTIARGELGATAPYTLGYDPTQTAGDLSTSAASQLVSFQQESEAPAETSPETSPAASPAPAHADAAEAEAAAPVAAGEPNYAWVTELPVEANEKLFKLGRMKFEQNCAVCHGFDGYGDGLVAQRAANLAQGYWLQPTSLHEDRIQQQPVGRLYYTITHGKGKMGSYAASLNPQERWAVVAYVRALQRSQNAQASDVPAGASVTQ